MRRPAYVTFCMHKFCLSCIQQWARARNSCPVYFGFSAYPLVLHPINCTVLSRACVSRPKNVSGSTRPRWDSLQSTKGPS
uniref:RING-type domain-containing protein n=1 Tax=Geospiza parvula TaxID=87175 RepID=A0A8U8C5I7_GEOPR